MDRNIIYLLTASVFLMSLSARRAWIEMLASVSSSGMSFVALRKESVDRNLRGCSFRPSPQVVALRKESVDRNAKVLKKETGPSVALRKESVDRNF